jgi:uncharacterized protein (TIGR03435 family)
MLNLFLILLFSGTALSAQTVATPANDASPAKRMDANDHPVFDVVTIKPSESDRLRWWGERGRHVFINNGKIADLLEISFNLHPKQITGGPEWIQTQQFDIDGIPDLPGLPNDVQAKQMFQQLLADRFKLSFHWEQRELPAYVIEVARSEVELRPSGAGPNDFQDFVLKRPGMLLVTNMSISDFANGMQRAVMDRPVVDRTGLTNRYTFSLTWMPDESQFIQLGWKFTPPTGADSSTPPNLFTAVTEQLGLKMEAVKTTVRVMVIDHIDYPSPN